MWSKGKQAQHAASYFFMCVNLDNPVFYLFIYLFFYTEKNRIYTVSCTRGFILFAENVWLFSCYETHFEGQNSGQRLSCASKPVEPGNAGTTL